jgi:hypothetical protein
VIWYMVEALGMVHGCCTWHMVWYMVDIWLIYGVGDLGI